MPMDITGTNLVAFSIQLLTISILLFWTPLWYMYLDVKSWKVILLTSAVVEDRFLCRHVGSKFIPTATIVDKTMVRKYNVNAVMFRPKSNFELRNGSSGLAGSTVVGWASSMLLHSLDSELFANSQALLKAYFIFVFKCILSFSK